MIGSDDGPRLIWGLVMLAVLLSSLAARRMPVSQLVRQAAAWVAIFAVLYGLLLFRTELAAIWDRARADITGSRQAVVTGQRTVVKKDDDGHFWVTATVNGQSLDFLIDSGATMTTISAEAATRAGVAVDRGAMPAMVDTANGTAPAWRAQVASIRVGGIAMEDLPVHVSETGGSVNLLGMNWLSRLSSWEVRGDEMILEP